VTDIAAFGAWLRSCRESAGLSQEQLAERAGLSIRAIRNLEHGHIEHPHPGTLQRLADALSLHGQPRASFITAASRTPPRATTLPRVPRQRVPRSGGWPAVPRQLPTPVRQFTGRQAEVTALAGLLGHVGASAPAAMMISAIGGTAGVGKTALAVYWAHQVAERFPDGQLYVNLRGYDPAGRPVQPAEAIRGFLDALEVPPGRIPASLQAQAGLYRSLLSGRQMLIVLDNAANAAQVRPLLPGGSGCLVVVTSRSQLSGLVAAEGAQSLTLDVLTEAEARELLAGRLGAARLAAEPGAANELIALCARLPLALAIAAARAAARPGFRLAVLAEELRDARMRLDLLETGDAAASMRAAFSWSLSSLSASAVRMFALLGVHPGPDITMPAAASLTGMQSSAACRALEELTGAHLVAEQPRGRFAMHDLLRAYAAEHAAATSDDASRHAAVARVLDHYLHTASPAALLLRPVRDVIALAPPRPGAVPEQPADQRQALAWFEAEHQVLLAAVTLADSSGFDSHAWQLPWAMVPFLETRGHYQEWAATQRTALAAATRVGEAAGQAVSSCLLASACDDLRDYDQALGHYASSLRLYQRLGNRVGEANVHQNLGLLAEHQGRYADALGHAQQALGLYQTIGHKAGEAVGLNYVGWCHGLLGDYQQAQAYCRRSLALCAGAGYRRGEGRAWDSLGYAEHHLRNLPEAAACYERALAIARELGDRWVEADTLTHLGDTRNAAGDLPQAREAWQQALAIFEDIQHGDAAKVSAKLGGLDAESPPSPEG
jgi:tetratricopeptide (TPR) repeat protein/transcriptional regulator with XRE-family HTH domain